MKFSRPTTLNQGHISEFWTRKKANLVILSATGA